MTTPIRFDAPMTTGTLEAPTIDAPPPPVRATRERFAPENPPDGQRLRISVLAGELGITLDDMAAVAGISRTAVGDLITSNRWPKRTPRETIEAALRGLFAERNVSPQDLAELFHAHTARRRLQKVDGLVRTPPPTIDQEITDMLLAKHSLTPGAKKAFTLFTNPFDGEVTSESEMFVSGEIRFVREACWQTAVNGSFVSVMGESGAGKTTLLCDLEDRILTSHQPVIVIKPAVVAMEERESAGKMLKAGDILAAIILTLDPNVTVKQTSEARMRQAAASLENSTKNGNSHLLVIEEAHSLPVATLRHLKRLQEHTRLGRRNMIGILLLGHPELKHNIEKVREVAQRCEQVTLMPLDGELRKYLEHRAQLAGHDINKLISDDGIEALRQRLTVERKGGFGKQATYVSLLYPLAVNNLMTAALNTAAELGAPVVNKDVVRSI
jgi:type II secretory pathway predicted ATPase ExeA